MGAKLSRFADIVNKRRRSESSPETGHDPAVHGAKLEDRFYNNDSFKTPSVDPSNPQQQDAAVKIQTNFRQHAAKEEVQVRREEEAAIKIQAGIRGHIDRQEILKEKNPEEYKKRESDLQERLAAQKGQTEEEEEVDIDLNDPDVEKAAIKIQAGFKGFKARKEVQEVKSKDEESAPDTQEPPAPEQADDNQVDIDLRDPDLSSAATKIQANYRGHRARKEIIDRKSQVQNNTLESNETQISDESADIDLNDPDLGHAALKIQATFRGHMVRRNMHQEDQAPPTQTEEEEEEIDIDLNDPEVEKAATKIQASFKGFKARKELQSNTQEEQKDESAAVEEKKEEEEIDIDLDDPNTEKAAIKIQAQFRGFQTRKERKTNQTEPQAETGQDDTPAKAEEEEEVDIDLTDPEVEKAAVKIQSSFKGFKARKEMKSGADDNQQPSGEPGEAVAAAPEENQQEAKEDQEEVDIDLNDPEVAQAALKIQAGFKGFKARKDQEKQQKKDEEQ